MEFVAPQKWIKLFLTFGDRIFERLLTKVSNRNQSEQAEDYYNEKCKRQNVSQFKEMLSKLPRSYLVDKIQTYERTQHRLLNVIGGYKKKQKELNNRVNVLELNRIQTELNHEREILRKTFDHAFME